MRKSRLNWNIVLKHMKSDQNKQKKDVKITFKQINMCNNLSCFIKLTIFTQTLWRQSSFSSSSSSFSWWCRRERRRKRKREKEIQEILFFFYLFSVYLLQSHVMHFHKEFHISDDVISVTDHILLTQFSTLYKNDVNFIKRFMKISRSFSQNLN